jgi:hypothetical protein
MKAVKGSLNGIAQQDRKTSLLNGIIKTQGDSQNVTVHQSSIG